MTIFDLANRAAVSVIGDEVTYHAGGAPITLRGVFTAEDEEVLGDGSVISTNPSLLVRGADLPAGVVPRAGHRVRVRAQDFEVFEVREDDGPAYVLFLKRNPL